MTLLEGIAVMTAIAVAAYIIYRRVAAAIRLRRLRDKIRVDRIVESLRARQQENVVFYDPPPIETQRHEDLRKRLDEGNKP